MTSRRSLALATAALMTAAIAASESLGPDGGALTSLVIAPAMAATSEELLVAGPLGEKTLGDPNAPNVVIEYASMTCPHCRNFHEGTFEAFKEKYIDTGEVYFIFRHFPLNPLDTAAVMLTNCAAEDKFFTLVDHLFEQQPNWAFVEQPAMALFEQVKQAGFTQESFTACLQDQEILDGIEDVRNRAAQEFDVQSTPTFFFNGEMTAGSVSLEQIDEILAN